MVCVIKHACVSGSAYALALGYSCGFIIAILNSDFSFFSTQLAWPYTGIGGTIQSMAAQLLIYNTCNYSVLVEWPSLKFIFICCHASVLHDDARTPPLCCLVTMATTVCVIMATTCVIYFLRYVQFLILTQIPLTNSFNPLLCLY